MVRRFTVFPTPLICMSDCLTITPSALTVYYIENEKRSEASQSSEIDCSAMIDVQNKTLVVRSD